jgi:hypothetical protein
MNYSQAQIANVALLRIGARGQITNINDNSPNAVKVLAVWDTVYQEVLSERDWKFAKSRVELQLSTQKPLYAWCNAWAMPSDFLRFVRPQKRPLDNLNWAWMWAPEGWGWYHRQDPPFWPGVPYKVETLPALCNFLGGISGTTLTVTQVMNGQLSIGQNIYDTTGGILPSTTIIAFGTGAGYNRTYVVSNSQTVASEPMYSPDPTRAGSRYAITDYAGCYGPAKINYIRLITDYTQLMPGFVNCLAFRLAAELAISITEDKAKSEGMHELYRDSLNSAEAQNETMDFQKDEAGSSSWLRAGREIYWG